MSNFPVKTFLEKELPAPELRILSYGFRQLALKWRVQSVCNPFWQLYWNATPGWVLGFRNEFREMVPEKVILLPPYTIFSASVKELGVSHFWIHFSCGEETAQCRREPIELNASEFQQFLRPLEEDISRRKLQLYSLVGAALLAIPPEKFVSGQQEMPDARIYQALKLIQKQAGENELDIAEICQKTGMSQSNLYRLFQIHVNLTPKDYFTTCRMRRAYLMLVESDVSIKEIAQSMNFSDRYQFSKAFLRSYGMPPARARKIWNLSPSAEM